MAGTFSPRGGPRHAKSTASLVRVLGVLGVLHGVAGGLVHHPLHHPFGAVGPLTVVRHAPPAVPPYSTQVNIFRWLAAFPPPVLHRALVLAHGHPLHLHPPAVHHAPLPPPPPPVLPPPPPPLATPVAKTPVAPLPLSFNFPPGTGFNLPLDPAFNFNFPPDALPFAPGLLPTSAFLPARGLFPGPLPAAAPFPAAPFPAAPFPAAPFPVSPTFRTAPTPLPPLGFAPNGLLPGAFGTALPPINFDFGRAPSPSPPQPQQPPHHAPAPAGLTLPDGFHQHYRQYVPAANGITRATAGNLAL